MELNAGSGEGPTLKELVQMADANPLQAVLTVWQFVSGAISDFGDDLDFKVTTERGAMRELRKLGVVSDEVVALSDRLSKIRSEIVHQRPLVTADEAQDFIVAAWRLATELRRARADHAALHSKGDPPT